MCDSTGFVRFRETTCYLTPPAFSDQEKKNKKVKIHTHIITPFRHYVEYCRRHHEKKGEPGHAVSKLS